jgi:hypothetical protein
MRVLLVYPIFPKTFWSYEKILALVDRKVLLPPLGLVTNGTKKSRNACVLSSLQLLS